MEPLIYEKPRLVNLSAEEWEFVEGACAPTGAPIAPVTTNQKGQLEVSSAYSDCPSCGGSVSGI